MNIQKALSLKYSLTKYLKDWIIKFESLYHVPPLTSCIHLCCNFILVLMLLFVENVGHYSFQRLDSMTLMHIRDVEVH